MNLLQVVLELSSALNFFNAEYYSSHPYIEKVANQMVTANKNNAFCQFCHLKLCIQATFVIKFIQFIKKLKTMLPAAPFLPFLCLLALSNAAIQPIERPFSIANGQFHSRGFCPFVFILFSFSRIVAHK